MTTFGDLVDIIHVIDKIINAIETSQKFKDVCLEFKEYLWYISKNLESFQGKPLSDTTVVTLKRLKDVLEKAYQDIDSLQNHNFVYHMLNGTRIMKQIKEAESRVHQYMALFPIVQLNEAFRLISEKTNIILREPHESAPNRTDAASISGCSTTLGVSLRIFDFKELRSATDDFKHDHLIGSGAFGSVYKGLVKDNSGLGTMVVAIKRVHRKSDGQPFEEGEAEVKYLERISHPNVIKLLGYCNKIDKRKLIGSRRKEANIYLSVFEYMANGSLFSHLFSDKWAFEPLSWAQRIKIANGFAGALAFLHKLQIIHRDVKSANILLDSNFNSKLATFGSATDFNSHTEIFVRYGTSGYIAPEYIHYGKASEKIDVYAFGVTLLEILSGLHVIRLYMKVQQLMPQEIKTHLNIELLPWQKFIISTTSGLKNLDNLMDSRLDGECPLEAARLAVQLVVSCVDDDPNNRPSMEEAVKVLEQIQTTPSVSPIANPVSPTPLVPIPTASLQPKTTTSMSIPPHLSDETSGHQSSMPFDFVPFLITEQAPLQLAELEAASKRTTSELITNMAEYTIKELANKYEFLKRLPQSSENIQKMLDKETHHVDLIKRLTEELKDNETKNNWLYEELKQVNQQSMEAGKQAALIRTELETTRADCELARLEVARGKEEVAQEKEKNKALEVEISQLEEKLKELTDYQAGEEGRWEQKKKEFLKSAEF